jgi:hypothetical protein
MKKSLAALAALIIVGLAVGLVMQRRAGLKLRAENSALRAEAGRIDGLAAENKRLSNLLAQARQAAPSVPKEPSRELLKLRGEVGVVRKTAEDAIAEASKPVEAPLSGVTANPEMYKMLRNQQKLGLSMVYKGLGPRAGLDQEKLDALSNLLADHVMTNIDHITAVLRDGKTPQEMDAIFTQQEKETTAQVKELLGPDAFGKYEEYNRDLGSYLTAEQFKSMLPGDKETKDAQAEKLHALMRSETAKALAERGLSPDFQTVPTLNFRNIASQEEGERNIALLDSIYGQVQAGAAEFLNPAELQKFAEFRKLAVDNNRLALTVNRKLMAPAKNAP